MYRNLRKHTMQALYSVSDKYNFMAIMFKIAERSESETEHINKS